MEEEEGGVAAGRTDQEERKEAIHLISTRLTSTSKSTCPALRIPLSMQPETKRLPAAERFPQYRLTGDHWG